MKSNTFSIKNKQLVYVNVDETPFSRVRIPHSWTAAELRNYLAKTSNLSANVYFVDANGYSIAEEEEYVETISQLLHNDQFIKMKTEKYDSYKKVQENEESDNTTNRRRNQQTRIQKTTSSIFTGLLSIFRPAWDFVLKPIISLLVCIILLCIIIYYSYVKLVCGYGSFLPMVSMYCPVGQLDSISVPPINKLADQSIALGDVLMSADVNAPMRLVQGKSSLIAIRAQVMHSDIDTSIKMELTTQMTDLGKLIQEGADHLTSMLSSFGGTFDRLKIYTQYALDDLSKIIKQEISNNMNQLQTGHSQMEIENKLTVSFNDYMASITAQTDKILMQAQQTHKALESIKVKLETIQEINFKGKHISQKRINELKHGSFWSRIFDEGDLGIIKSEQNLKILDGLINFVGVASNNVNDVIIKLKLFKGDAEDLKQTAVQLETLPHISITKHAQFLASALTRLTDLKEKFEDKQQRIGQQNKDE